MTKHFNITALIILAGFILAPTVLAHPFDEPLTFRKHLTDDGRVIYSNIQKKCFSGGQLTCLKYHPIWKGGFLTAPESDDENASETTEVESDG